MNPIKEEKRVVITGLGVVSSIGIGKKDFWNSLINGKNGISDVSAFDTKDFPTHRGGEIKDFQEKDFISHKNINKMGRASLLAAAATRLALEDASLNAKKISSPRLGIIIGTTMGESKVLEGINRSWIEKGFEAILPKDVIQYPLDAIVKNICKELSLEGFCQVIPTACSAGNYSMGYAYDCIKNRIFDYAICGGTDGFSRVAYTGFSRLFAIAPELCQPFDKDRKGMIPGEGAGILILESLENALKRKAHIYAEVLGYGLSCDASHMTAPSVDGIIRVIALALDNAGIDTKQVDYICAHGTGTQANDKTECLAIKKVFERYSKEIPISSIKSMLGHTMGAASAIESIACCLAIQEGKIPPTINFKTKDPSLDIDCVPNIYRDKKLDMVLNNSFAFGGNNSCVVLSKCRN